MIFERFFSTPKTPHRLWSSSSYFSLTHQLDHQTLENSLNWDLISFLHEYVGMKDKKIYPYGLHGIRDAYYQLTSEICGHQEQILAEQGLEVTRAQLETKAALTVESWMADPTTGLGEKLIIISPRGTREEGYPGLDPKNYVFINVYQKTSADDFQLIQYTSYAPETELKKLQNSLHKELGGQDYTPPLPDRYTKIIPASLSNQIINRPLILPTAIEFSQIEQKIYEKEKTWQTTRDQLPQVREELFATEMERVRALLMTQFWLLAEQTPVVAATNFDLLVGIVRQHFLKWVEHHATNYHPDTDLAPIALNLELILDAWELERQAQAKTLDDEDRQRLKQIKKTVALDPLQPLLRASSVAHCIVGTPGSLAMKAVRLNPGLLTVGSPEFQALSQSDKQSLLDKIQAENMTEITLANGEKWMVPASFLAGKGCYLSPEGVAMGPCNIPLCESFAFNMDQATFNRWVGELEKQALAQELDQVGQELTESHHLSPTESQELVAQINQIKQLIFKPVVSITELISGDIVQNSHHNTQVAAIISQLKTATNPLAACEEILTTWLRDQNGVLLQGEV